MPTASSFRTEPLLQVQPVKPVSSSAAAGDADDRSQGFDQALQEQQRSRGKPSGEREGKTATDTSQQGTSRSDGDRGETSDDADVANADVAKAEIDLLIDGNGMPLERLAGNALPGNALPGSATADDLLPGVAASEELIEDPALANATGVVIADIPVRPGTTLLDEGDQESELDKLPVSLQGTVTGRLASDSGQLTESGRLRPAEALLEGVVGETGRLQRQMMQTPFSGSSDDTMSLAEARETATALQQSGILASQEAKTTPRTELVLSQRLGTPDWSEAMAGRISMLVNQKISAAQIRINPPEMGPIEVRINLNSDQASVQFISQSAQVRDALEQSMPRLREMLEQTGFTLAEGSVRDQPEQRSQSNGEPGVAHEDDASGESDHKNVEHEVLQAESLRLIDAYV